MRASATLAFCRITVACTVATGVNVSLRHLVRASRALGTPAGLGFGGSVGKVGAAAAAPLVSLLPLPSALAAAGALALAGSATAATLQQEEGS